jgi:O-Antigen ligase
MQNPGDPLRGSGNPVSRRALTLLTSVGQIGFQIAQELWRVVQRPKPRYGAQILKPYVNLNTFRLKLLQISIPISLAAFCLVYGFFFAITAPYLILPLAVPVVLMALLSIWALPDSHRVPTKTIEWLFSGAIISLIIWPNYLALVLPGLPWVTAARIFGTPMAILFLVALSSSRVFRGEISTVLKAIPNFWIWLTIFVVIQIAGVAFGKSPSSAVSKWIIQLQNWIGILTISAWVCRTPGRPSRYILFMFLLSAPMFFVELVEYSGKHLIWEGYIPSFLKIADPNVASVVYASNTRGATGQYRAKAVFTTTLGLAEYMSLMTPFAIHLAVHNYKLIVRIIGFLAVPLLFYAIRLTDARLGVVGFLISVIVYVFIWGMLRFRRNRRDILAATIVYAYPALFIAVALSITVVKPVHNLVMGGGAQAASNLARKHQFEMGLPSILTNPIGHGAGGAGAAMGYAEGDFIAIDNYYLAIGLNYGVIGLVTFLGVFLMTIVWSARTVLTLNETSQDRELALLIPIAACLSAFLIIKLFYAQEDLHPILYMLVGMAIALIYRAKQQVLARQAELADAIQEERTRVTALKDEGDDGNDTQFRVWPQHPQIRPRLSAKP